MFLAAISVATFTDREDLKARNSETSLWWNPFRIPCKLL